MYTIGYICKRFGISRSTILYYDKLGLLKPSGRQDNNYRVYNYKQINRLEKIIMYRNSGIALKDIERILDAPNNETSSILVDTLNTLQSEINELKKQELLIIDVLKEKVIYEKDVEFTPTTWSELLYNLGYSDNDALKWHKDFEEKDSTLHHKFLKSLKMTDSQIEGLILKLNTL